MKKVNSWYWATALLALLVLVEAGYLLVSRPAERREAFPPPAPLAIHVVEIEGEASSSPPGEEAWRILSEGDALSEGDRIRTGDPGSLTVDMGGRCRFTMGPGSFMRLTQADDPDTPVSSGIRLDLDRGSTLFEVEALSRPDRFQVVTPNAAAGVRGTRFIVTVEETGEREPD